MTDLKSPSKDYREAAIKSFISEPPRGIFSSTVPNYRENNLRMRLDKAGEIGMLLNAGELTKAYELLGEDTYSRADIFAILNVVFFSVFQAQEVVEIIEKQKKITISKAVKKAADASVQNRSITSKKNLVKADWDAWNASFDGRLNGRKIQSNPQFAKTMNTNHGANENSVIKWCSQWGALPNAFSNTK